MTSRYKVTILNKLFQLKDIAEEWNSLLLKQHNPIIFNSFQWVYHHAKCFSANDLHVICLYNTEDQLICIAPFKISSQPKGLFNRKLRCLELVVNNPNITDYTEILIDPKEDKEKILELISENIYSTNASWDVLLLDRYIDNSNSLWSLSEYLEKYKVKNHISLTQKIPSFTLPSTIYDYQNKIKSSRLRKTVNNLTNRIKKNLQAEPRLVFINDLDEGIEILKHLIVLNVQYWSKSKNKSGFVRYPGFDTFILDIYKSILADKRLQAQVQISMVMVKDSIISYQLGFSNNRQYIGYITNHSKDFRFYKPGICHFELLLLHAISSGQTIFEFGIGEEEYKYQWANYEQPVYCLTGANRIQVYIELVGVSYLKKQISKAKRVAKLFLNIVKKNFRIKSISGK